MVLFCPRRRRWKTSELAAVEIVAGMLAVDGKYFRLKRNVYETHQILISEKSGDISGRIGEILEL
jgi:hypothetical protein